MMFTLIVPFCFMVFMSMSMNRVWSLYLMLQVMSNINNFTQMMIPANAQYVVFIFQKISYFKIMQEANVQIWMRDHVFGRAQLAQKIIVGQGPLILGFIFVAGSLSFLLVAKKVCSNAKTLKKLKDKLMWSSILRS